MARAYQQNQFQDIMTQSAICEAAAGKFHSLDLRIPKSLQAEIFKGL